MLDTRLYRSPNSQADDETKTMLGDEQKAVFMDWLASVRYFHFSIDPPSDECLTGEHVSTGQSDGDLEVCHDKCTAHDALG
jgi:hypothetical protein